MRKHILTVACLGLGVLAWAQAERNSAAKMIAAAHRFLDGLRADQRLLATIPFHDEERQNWHYVPRPRKGVPLRQLTREQRELGDTLLRTGLSEEGFEKTKNIRLLDQVLFDESRNPIRDQEAYFFSIFGEPTAKDWGWRVEGHHLSLNFTVHDGQVASSTPFFFGANPAEIRRGPRAGLRVLAAEEEMGRGLLRSLQGAQREKALISVEAPADIVTGSSRKARLGAPSGIALAEMSPEQARLLMDMIAMYANRLRPELAEMELAKLRQAGLGKIHFAWAGGSAPGQPHYYRIQGPTFVVEYDNTQNNANHIHTVWRDFDNDFGLDPLRAHYATSPHHRNVRLTVGAR